MVDGENGVVVVVVVVVVVAAVVVVFVVRILESACRAKFEFEPRHRCLRGGDNTVPCTFMRRSWAGDELRKPAGTKIACRRCCR